MSICFRLGGCPVEARFSFFALLAFCCLFLGAGNSVFFLAAAACHESAHVAALFYWKAPPAKLLLSGLGCRLTLDPNDHCPMARWHGYPWQGQGQTF